MRYAIQEASKLSAQHQATKKNRVEICVSSARRAPLVLRTRRRVPPCGVVACLWRVPSFTLNLHPSFWRHGACALRCMR